MDLPVQRVLRPRTLDEALVTLADQAARPIAGGTDLVVQLRDGRRRASVVVDLGALGLAGIEERDGGLAIGAATSMFAIAADRRVAKQHPALAAAAGLIGAWPIQCRATLGGNLANASPAADTAPPLLIADAIVEVVSAAITRRIPIDGFFVAPGKSALTTGELITAVFVPAPTVRRGRVVERFVKVGPRQEQIISTVSLAARAIVARDGTVTDVRLALGSVAPTPVRAGRTEKFLDGRRIDGATRRDAARVLQDDIAPIDDVRGPARYRRLVAAVVLDRFLEACHG